METRIFFACDVHGSEKTFRRFVNAGKFYKANCMILAGDLTGKMLVPIIQEPNGEYTAEFGGVKHVAKNKTDLHELEEKIKTNGFYLNYSTSGEFEELKNDPDKLKAIFKKLIIKRLEEWLKLAEDNLKNSGIVCYINPGNDDELFIDEIFNKHDYVTNPDRKVLKIDSKHEMLTLGYSNITPWKCPRDISEEELSEKIEALASQVHEMKNCIFNLHCPPFDSDLDIAPALDENFTPIREGNAWKMIPVGSTAVRRAIERHQPLLGLHGHIHESRGRREIGKTLCINPGSEYGEGVLRGALINLSDGKVKSYILISG